MVEATGAPLPPPSAPQKTNPWIIVVAVIVVVCCSCFGMIGLLIAFGPDVLHELGLYTLLPLLRILL
jgi:hypothetical protein